MNIIECNDVYAEAVKDLFVELQSYLAGLDKRGVIVLKDGYRDDYFHYVSEEIKKHRGKIFLAEENNAAVGCIVCKIFQGGGEDDITTSCPKVGFIGDLVVTQAKRGQGIGSALLQRAEKYFAKNDCDYTQLEVFAPNTDAFELYKKSGYKVNCLYLSKKCK